MQVFTKEMKDTHTILIPYMLPIHFDILTNLFVLEGYKIELLFNQGQRVIDEGLENVHNDTCYPALLVIGQFLDALKSHKYDLNKTALFITQTGGGCRASNYIHLLRKVLDDTFPQVPVISFNFSGLETNQGFTLKFTTYLKMLYSVFYGDILMSLYNQVLPYEVHKGAAKAKLEELKSYLKELQTSKLKYYSYKKITKHLIKEFKKVEVTNDEKIKVGIVGEIFVKYSPLANNNLEEFLINEGMEVVVPSLADFVLYCIDTPIFANKKYKQKNKKAKYFYIAYLFSYHIQRKINKIFKKDGTYDEFHDFKHLKKLANKYINEGVVMGEGWLIPAEMAALNESGVHNIVATQPFGCLPNHIICKGMIRKLKEENDDINVVAIDYDPGASKVNQENRIKLMISLAKEKMKNEKNY